MRFILKNLQRSILVGKIPIQWLSTITNSWFWNANDRYWLVIDGEWSLIIDGGWFSMADEGRWMIFGDLIVKEQSGTEGEELHLQRSKGLQL